MAIELPPGKYTLETAVMDRESGNMGTGHSEFSVAPTAQRRGHLLADVGSLLHTQCEGPGSQRTIPVSRWQHYADIE